MDLSHLNPSQRRAVETTEGPVLVLAGAGSGKTRVITHRIQRLVEMGIPPESIVALSFTNKAAGEMRERLHRMVGGAVAEKLVLSTFHSLGVRMIREDPDGFDLPSRFTILDQGDVYGIVRSLLREYGFHGPGNDRRFDLGAVVQRISLWKNEFVDEDDLREKAKYGNEYDEVTAVLYQPYEDRLRSLGAVDFDDLVVHIAATLRDSEPMRAHWQRKFAYLMVDEYQDTNSAQFEMLRHMLTPAQNLCVVGDDDQAIYGWRGAKVANILGFDMMFPNAEVIRLQENYRSRAQICRVANGVISHNEARHEKVLVPTRGEGEKVYSVLCNDGTHEAEWVTTKIRRLIHEQQVHPDAIAVLYRSARQARLIEEGLQEHGVAYRVLGGQSFYDKKEVKDVLAYLKVVVAPHDEIALRRAIDVPSRGVGRRTMEQLSAYAKANKVRLIDAVHRVDEIPDIASRPRQALENFSRQIKHVQAKSRATKSVVEPLKDWIAEIGLRDNVYKETGSAEATEKRWQGVDWLMGSVERFEDRARDAKKGSWSEYLTNLSLDRSKDAKDEDDDGPRGQVSLATMHSAKGLEWPHVFVIGCEEGIIPHKRVEAAKASDAIEGDLEEERRLFYVAITRARDQLWLTRAKARIDRGRELEVKPSRFLAELPPADLYEYDIAKEEPLTEQSMDDLANAFFAKFADAESG